MLGCPASRSIDFLYIEKLPNIAHSREWMQPHMSLAAVAETTE
jgi:hypothetical protein